MAKITFINKTDKTQVFQKHSYGFMTIKPGETVDLYLDYTKDITTKAFIKSFYSPYESIFDITYSFDEDVSKPYLEFSSDGDFTLSAPKKSGKPYWNGVIEYSIDEGVTWTEWDGSELSGNVTQPIYLRGTGNHKISDGSRDATWAFTGKYCTGNIENLLDYQTVANGEHPVMTAGCYSNMFFNCTSLTTAPELPAVTLAKYCYDCMFRSCTSLITAPALPATTLVDGCYKRMFMSCKSLTIIPELLATELVGGAAESGCYYEMFQYCNSLKLSETKTGEYQYVYRIPMTGTGTLVNSGAITSMFSYTGGTFKGTPEINTTYYTDHEPV